MGMARVLSVNLARPRMLARKRGEEGTGIFKEPAEGPVRLDPGGVVGDLVADRSVHGGVDKAVYAYAREDTLWWEAELGRELPHGTFGENLTLDGIELEAAEVGERWRIGEAVVEVSEPRFPCWKLAAKMGDPLFIRRFADARRSGAYLRVIEAGEVAAGDPVELVSRPGHGITIALFVEAYVGDRSLLARLLEAPALSHSWREWALKHAA
jgi:MOSC domain-containing protein YiiM